MSDSAARLDALDLLRGFALLGMILVHFHQRMETEASGLEGLIGWVVWMGVEQKAWATFALLFGAGFAILLRRLSARGLPVAASYLRRLLGLFVIGIAVAVFWGFHILMDYAIWGVPLLLVRNWSTRALGVLALVSTSAVHLVRLAEGPPPRNIERIAARESLRRAEAQTSYPVLVSARAGDLAARYRTGDRSLFIPNVNLALFILGLLAVRHGVFEDPRRHTRAIGAAMGAGLLVWAVSWWGLPLIPMDRVAPSLAGPLQAGFGVVADIWLALTYVGAVVLLLDWRPAWRARLAFVGWAGRMALTNYVLQAALIDAAASPYGLGLRIRPYGVLLATAALFVLQAILSRRWLARYRVGPLEWLLRSLTYARLEPQRIDRPSRSAG